MKTGSIYKVQYTSSIVQSLADSTFLGSVINKLEEAVICWLLAFKASRQNKQNRTFIYHGTYKTFCFVSTKMDGTAARTTHFHPPFHFSLYHFCFVLFSIFRISLTVLCHKNSSSCIRVAVRYNYVKNNLQTKLRLPHSKYNCAKKKRQAKSRLSQC